jgi:lipoate-protein ligase B
MIRRVVVRNSAAVPPARCVTDLSPSRRSRWAARDHERASPSQSNEKIVKRMLLVELPLTDYEKSLEIQTRIVERKILHRGGEDVLLVLEHPPTITVGKRGNDSDVIASEGRLAGLGVSVYSVSRGGGATYHGPGQIVCYPIVDLRRLGLRIRDYVHRLEEAVIRTLHVFGVQGLRQPKMPGVWIDESHKIASVGVRIRRGVTSHGLSLNVNMTIDPGELIIVCGVPTVHMVNLAEMVTPPVEMPRVRDVLTQSFSEVFGISLERASLQRAADR